MIDFVKFTTKVNSSEFEKNKLLDFKECYSKRTGMIDKKSIAIYNGLKFDLYDNGFLIVSGSIHKYYNFIHNIKAPNQITPEDLKKGFNGNLYNVNQIHFTLIHISKSFNLNLNNCKILNIEVGLNLIHDYSTPKILNGLMLHKGKVFNKPLANTYREATHQRYYFKIYDKALQYGLTQNMIRVELKYKKMIDVHTMGVYSLIDLIDINKIYPLIVILRNEFNKIILFDYTIDITRLKPKELIKIKDYSNTYYWNELKANRRDKPKRNLAKLINTYSQNIQFNISESIEVFINGLIKKSVIFNPESINIEV